MALPPILRDVVKTVFAGRPEVAVVGEIDRTDGALAALAESEANVVFVGVREDDLTPACARLLEAPPNVRVLTIRKDGRTGDLYRVNAVRVAIEELSIAALFPAAGVKA